MVPSSEITSIETQLADTDVCSPAASRAGSDSYFQAPLSQSMSGWNLRIHNNYDFPPVWQLLMHFRLDTAPEYFLRYSCSRQNNDVLSAGLLIWNLTISSHPDSLHATKLGWKTKKKQTNKPTHILLLEVFPLLWFCQEKRWKDGTLMSNVNFTQVVVLSVRKSNGRSPETPAMTAWRCDAHVRSVGVEGAATLSYNLTWNFSGFIRGACAAPLTGDEPRNWLRGRNEHNILYYTCKL